MNANSPATSKVALITGASRGIGRAIALELAEIGCSVIVNYASRADAAEAVVAEIAQLGGSAVAVQGSVGVAADRQRLIDAALGHYGRLDVLVNNAGITSPGRLDLLDATEENWDQVFDINLKGPFFLAQAAARAMIELRSRGVIDSGTIVNISSLSAFTVSTNRADYCMTKAAQGMMTQLLAVRLADESIRAYELCPGVIATDMTGPVKAKYDALIAEGLSPIRRWGQGSDVAKAVSALVQEYFPFSTGERIHIDGGFHIQRL